MSTSKVHSVASLFSYGARLTACQASYVETQISPQGEELTVLRAWSAGDEAAVYCPVGLMCYVDMPRDYVEPSPTPAQAARVLYKRKSRVDHRTWEAQLTHFMRNWDAGRYHGRLDEVLGVDLTALPPLGMVDVYGKSILGGWAAPGWQPWGSLRAAGPRANGSRVRPSRVAEAGARPGVALGVRPAQRAQEGQAEEATFPTEVGGR